MSNPERGFFNPDAWMKPPEIKSAPKEHLAIADLFERAGIPLSWKLQEMLRESSEHRYLPETGANLRKGSGFLQVTRELAVRMRVTDRANDVRRIAHRPLLTFLLPRLIVQATETRPRLEELGARAKLLLAEEKNVELAMIRAKEMLYAENVRPSGARADMESYAGLTLENRYELSYELDRLQDELCDLIAERLEGRRMPGEWWTPDPRAVETLRNRLADAPEGERLIGHMLLDLISPREVTANMVVLPHRSRTEQVGTCTTAEVYFFDVAVRSLGYADPDIVVDESGAAVMLLKNAGERSALTLVETVLDGVRLPPGSLVALEEADPRVRGIVPLSSVSGVQFLRLTSLAISLEGRAEAVGTLYDMQRSQGMDGFDSVTTDDLRVIAQVRVRLATKTPYQAAVGASLPYDI
jgi:hypothetical protein